METLNPYEAPQGELPPQSHSWRESFSALAQQSRVSWGAALCFWALMLYLCFNIGVSLMMDFVSFATKLNFYYPLRQYGTWAAVILHPIGLLLCCYVGEQTRAKTLFKLSLGCYLANVSWQLMRYFEPLDQHEAAPIPPSVAFAAELTWFLSAILLLLALRRISLYCRDQQLLRWSYVAFVIYTLMAMGSIAVLALFYFKPEVEWQAIYFRKFNLVQAIHHLPLLLGLPVAYCYGRMLRRITVLWEQTPSQGNPPQLPTTITGVNHEPESV